MSAMLPARAVAAGRVRDEVGLAAQHRAERAAERGNGAGQNANPQPARGDFQMIARRERDNHPGENHDHAKNFREVQPGAEPEPFDERGEGRGETLREQNGAAAAEPGQRLEIRAVAEADAKEAAQHEPFGCAVETGAEKVRPNGQENGSESDAPEIGLDAADLPGGAITADGGRGEEQRGEQGREHQSCS